MALGQNANLHIVHVYLERGCVQSFERASEAFGGERRDKVHGQGVAGNNPPMGIDRRRQRLANRDVPGERVRPCCGENCPPRAPRGKGKVDELCPWYAIEELTNVKQ